MSNEREPLPNASEDTSEETSAAHEKTMTRRKFEELTVKGAAAVVLTGMVGSEKNPAMADNHEHIDLQALWDAQQPMYDRIAEKGMQACVDKLSQTERESLFFDAGVIAAGRCACCADEGIRQPKVGSKPMALLRTAGAGIWAAMDRSDKDPFAKEIIQEVARTALNNGVTVFTGHAGCGAAKNVLIEHLKATGIGAAVEGLTDDDFNTFAQKWALAVTKAMQEMSEEEGVEITSDFITKLDRPAIHDGRMIMIDDTDAYDSSNPHLPKSFVESVIEGKIDVALKEAKVLASIAFGDHGLGNRFTAEKGKQLVLCCVASDAERLQAMIAKTQQSVAGNDRITVTGFVRA